MGVCSLSSVISCYMNRCSVCHSICHAEAIITSLRTYLSHNRPGEEKLLMIAYRRGPIAYIREWRQREQIRIPYVDTDSDLRGPFVTRPKLHINSAFYGTKAGEKCMWHHIIRHRVFCCLLFVTI